MSTISEKLERVNSSEKNEITFQVIHKNKSLYEGKMDVPLYAGNVIEENEQEFYYFFKDMEIMFANKISEIQKKQYLKSQQ